MKIFIIEDYRAKAPELKGKKLTDFLVGRCLNMEKAEILRMDGGKVRCHLTGARKVLRGEDSLRV